MIRNIINAITGVLTMFGAIALLAQALALLTRCICLSKKEREKLV